MLGVSQSRVLTALLSFAASLAVAFGLVLVPPSAHAGSSLLCSGYSACKRAGYDHFGYETKQRTSYWRMYTGTNCTNYVAYRLVTTNGMPNVRPKSGVGNARDWGKAMASVTNSTPTVGSVAWWGRTGNHVAYVERVASPTEIIVSESNWGRTFDHRRITKSGSGWPDGFIHFDDPSFVNTAKPAISGTARVGEKLTASNGSWKPAATSHRYEWRADGTVIAGATSSTFTPTAAQSGRAVTVRVTAGRSGLPAVTATSASRTVAPGVLRADGSPTIAGTARVDATLTATPPRTTPGASATRYRWSADGDPIAGATAARLVLTPDLLGRRITVATTGTRAGYTDATTSSSASPAVAPGVLTSTTAPSISGRPAVDAVLTASPGGWSRPDVVASYQWLVDGKPVEGATSRTFAPRVADTGKQVGLRVTVRRAGYVDATRAAASTTPVTVNRFTRTAAPTITGTPRVAQRLTASVTAWSPTATLTYQWFVDGRAVSGADRAYFYPRSGDRGKPITVKVTGSRAGYAAVTSTSARSAAVATGTIVADRPRITGTLTPGTVIGTDLGSVSGGTKFTYQWLLDGKAVKGETGPRHRVRDAELGRKLSVRVGYRAAGRADRAQTTAAVTPRARPTVKVGATSARRQVRVTVTVSARGTAKPAGSVLVSVGGASRTVTVKNGKATTTFSSVKVGRHDVVASYRGTAKIQAGTARTTTTVR